MDVDLLRTFVAICEQRSFTAAARQVGRSQSAVSLQIRRLEESLGRPLFVRGASSVTLTEHGDLLLGHAREILGSVDVALAAFDRTSITGIVMVGLPDDYAPRILPFVLTSIAQFYPDMTVDVVIDESRALVQRLAEGSVDLAFVTEGEGPVTGGPVVFGDRIVWVGPDSGDTHRLDPVPVAVWNDDDTYSKVLLGALEAAGRAYRIAVVSRNMTGLRMAVASGLAVSAMVSSSLVSGMRELLPEEGFPPLPQVQVRLECGHLKRSPVIERLAAHLVERFAELRSGVAG